MRQSLERARGNARLISTRCEVSSVLPGHEQASSPRDSQWYQSPLWLTGIALIDATYKYGFARLAGKLPASTLGGYPTQYYGTAYNAGYGEWGLAGQAYRDQGILSYEFMVRNGQSGPDSWWESQQFPNPGSPWTGTHPEAGNGSFPARLGHRQRQPGPAGLAGRPAVGRLPGDRPGDTGLLGARQW